MRDDVQKTIAESAPVQIFDEVDAGVGGDTANSVGQMLHDIGGGAQTLCVTHLAQVAARAHHQVKIEKVVRTGRDFCECHTAGITVAREEEIARMLSGKVSENSLAHARELISENSAGLRIFGTGMCQRALARDPLKTTLFKGSVKVGQDVRSFSNYFFFRT